MHKYIKTKPRQNNVLMILHGNTRLILLCFRNRSKSKCWGDDETKNSFSLWNFFFSIDFKILADHWLKTAALYDQTTPSPHRQFLFASPKYTPKEGITKTHTTVLCRLPPQCVFIPNNIHSNYIRPTTLCFVLLYIYRLIHSFSLFSPVPRPSKS